MSERKFTKRLGKIGLAAQLRENVSQAVKATAIQARSKLGDPLNYEEYLSKNKVLLENDPIREMVLFPVDNVQQNTTTKESRTLNSLLSSLLHDDINNPLALHCLKYYCSTVTSIAFKDVPYSGLYHLLPRFPNAEELKEHIHEIDLTAEHVDNGDESFNDVVLKKGFLLKGPDYTNEKSSVNFSSKTFKRRFTCLKQQIDGSYTLDFYRDERKQDAESAILLQFCTAVRKNPKRGIYCFELHYSIEEGNRVHIMSAECEEELMDWTEKLGRIINYSLHSNSLDGKGISSVSSNNVVNELDLQKRNLGTHLLKTSQENSYSRQQSRIETRINIFNCCNDIERDDVSVKKIHAEEKAQSTPRQFGLKFRVICENLKFGLQAPVNGLVDEAPLSQIEPYMTHLALYDVVAGKKVSEDFYFDLNSPMARNLLKDSISGCAINVTNSQEEDETNSSPLSLVGVPEEWLARPKQCLFTVSKPSPGIYLVLFVNKVLQGSISSSVEPYLKQHNDAKSLVKLQKTIKTCCAKLGDYRMPFGWSFRRLFREDGELDLGTDFSPIYKFEDRKTSQLDLIKLLQDKQKGHQSNKLTVIPGSLAVKVSPLSVTPNCLTPSLEPVIPFPNPPSHQPTFEMQEFPADEIDLVQVNTSYINNLYVYPKHLNFDHQKIFGRARNIVCYVQFKDSDEEGSQPLRVIYNKVCHAFASASYASLTSYANTVVLHHNSFPEWSDEVKISLPPNLTKRHHLLFTFAHIAIEGTKAGKKEEATEIIGYSWLPVLLRGRINTEDNLLPVAASLPPKYLSIEPFGLGKGFAGPDIRWVDNQKNLFKMSTRLVSSIVTDNQLLQDFFTSTSELLDRPKLTTNRQISETSFNCANSPPALHSSDKKVTGRDSVHGLYRRRTDSFNNADNLRKERMNSESERNSDTSSINSLSQPKSETSSASTIISSCKPTTGETVKNLKALLGIDTATFIRFLPVIVNRILSVMVVSNDEVESCSLSLLVELTSRLHSSNRLEVFQGFIEYDVNIYSFHQGGSTLHESLCNALISVFAGSVNIEMFLVQMETLLEIVIRSMSLHLLTTDRIKMDRRERFSSSFNESVRKVLSTVATYVIQNWRESYSQSANAALAIFVKDLLTLMDRGLIFSLIKDYLELFNPGDRVGVQLLKLSFLRTVCSHPYFIQLNLPIFCTANVNKDWSLSTEEYQLSPSFVSSHYLVGALLVTVESCLREVAEVQRAGVALLRDMLTKHSADDRYTRENQQGRISCLYLPLLGVLLENLNRLQWPSVKALAKMPSKKPEYRSSVTGSQITIPSSIDGGKESTSTPKCKVSSRPPSAYGTPIKYQSSVTSSHDSARKYQNSVSSKRSEASYLSLIAGSGGFDAGFRMTGLREGTFDLMLGSEISSTTSLDSLDYAASEVTLEESDKEDCESINTHTRNVSISFAGETGEVKRYDKVHPTRELLLCLLQVLKHVPHNHMVSVWNNMSNDTMVDFLSLLHLCLLHFRYCGENQNQRRKRYQNNLPTNQTTRDKSNSKINFSFGEENRGKSNSVTKKPSEALIPSLKFTPSSRRQILLDSNLSTQVGLICLDVMNILVENCAQRLRHPHAVSLLTKVVGLHLIMMQVGQSDCLLKHIFGSLRGIMETFPDTLFKGDSQLCCWLCFELLKSCNSKITSVRQEASMMLYLLMKANFVHSDSINRMHLQVIISVSQLQGEVRSLNNYRFQESMALINSYALADTNIKRKGLMTEVQDLTTRVRTVLVATAEMEKHTTDPEMLCSLQHSLADSYSATAQLRTTWLNSMAKMHINSNNLSEAAMCEMHIGAVMAERLKARGVYPGGCDSFAIISPNIERDEKKTKIDHADIDADSEITLDSLVNQLQCCALLLDKAERYEQLGNLYRLLIPIYEERRDYSALVQSYSHLHHSYSKVIELNTSHKRLLGTYFRVRFYGSVFFEEESGKEYVYKEPKVTSLAEVSERLHSLYTEKFGRGNVKMIMDSNAVNEEELDSKLAHIQVTHLTPYFTEQERSKRETDYEKNNNINMFVYETPFTRCSDDGEDQSKSAAHGRLENQWKRRVIVTTKYHFPYVQKRIAIVHNEVEELSPIEVAIDEMETRIKDLSKVINETPTDIKKLQLKLQGSISVQVNAGPLAYATTFLQTKDSNRKSSSSNPETVSLSSLSSLCYPMNKVNRLRELYKQFMMTCKVALDLNGKLVSSDQTEYQMALESTYNDLLTALKKILGRNIHFDEECSKA